MATSLAECGGCKKEIILNDHYLQCSLCNHRHHCECLNITVHQFSRLSNAQKAAWKCPSCSNVTNRKKSNINTPVRETQLPIYRESLDMSYENSQQHIAETDPSFLTPPRRILPSSSTSNNATQNLVTQNDLRKFADDLKSSLDSWRLSMESAMSDIRDDIKNTLSNIQKDLSNLRTEQTNLKQEVAGLSNDVSELKIATQFQAGESEDLKKQFTQIHSKLQAADDYNSSLSTLESKMDTLEQQARQCNLEINNVPEKRNENLLLIMESIGQCIKYPISQSDLVSIHRVPHASKDSNRPKNIIAKFNSKSTRDNILSAYRKCKELKTDRVGISGAPSRIYMSEHLTLKRKHLFRLCREAARKHNFKYVWIKNATILVREFDSAPAIAIRSADEIEKIMCKAQRNQN